MAAVSHGARQLRQGVGVPRHAPARPARSIHTPAHPPRPSAAQRIFAETRTFFSRLVSHLAPHPLPHSSLVRPTQFHTIGARFSLPVNHALSRPFSPPRLPRPPAVPPNVTHVGLGTARAFHSGRPIFQNMVDNVPVATRALWEAEWDIKIKKKEARRMRRTAQHKPATRSSEMLKPRPDHIASQSRSDASELDAYFPMELASPVITHLLVPLAPTPTARLPLSAHSDGSAHPLLPISDLVSTHTSHRLHSLRVSTLFSRLDAANVWDDPGVNVDAYAFGPRYDAHEKQCTVLRVTFKGWNVGRVRAILGDSAEEWYSLEETNLDEHPVFVPSPDLSRDMHTSPVSPSLESVGFSSTFTSDSETDDGRGVLSPPPGMQLHASTSAQHNLILPTLDFSCALPGTAVDFLPPQPIRSMRDAAFSSSLSSSSNDSESPLPENSWECLGLSSSFLRRRDEVTRGV